MEKDKSGQTSNLVKIGTLELDLNDPADAKTYELLNRAMEMSNIQPTLTPAEERALEEVPQIGAARVTETPVSKVFSSENSLFRGGAKSRSLFNHGGRS